MRESTECLNKQLQAPRDAETCGHNKTNNCEEADLASDVPENITNGTLSYVDYAKFIQEIDEIQELSPNFYNNIEGNQNVANYITENANDNLNVIDFNIDAIVEKRLDEILAVNDIPSENTNDNLNVTDFNIDAILEKRRDDILAENDIRSENTNDNLKVTDFNIDAIVEKRLDEIMAENDIRSVSLIEQKYEQQNTVNVMFGEEILNETYDFKETPANNGGSVDTYATEINNAQNSALMHSTEATKLNYNKTLALQYKIEIEIKRINSDVEIEIKNEPLEDVLSEFLNFNKINNSVEPSNEDNEISNNIGEAKKKGKETLKKHKKNTTVKKDKVMPTKKYKCDLCDSEFMYKRDATKHGADKHGLRYKCNECEFSTVYMQKLKKHTRRHTEGMLYACELCSYKSHRKDLLKRHCSTHKVSPYICNECGFKYISIHGYSRHRKTHHSYET